MKKIFHIASTSSWNGEEKEYRGDTLDTQGFIHCSTKDQILEVANHIFRGRDDLKLLVIDEEKLRHPVKYEDSGDGNSYPHVYGPLNHEAVVTVLEFPSNDNGLFVLPIFE